MKATLQLDTQVCSGSGLCQAMNPEVFGIGEELPSVEESELTDAEQIRLVQQIAQCCPTGAIVVIVDDGDRAWVRTTDPASSAQDELRAAKESTND